MKKWIACFFFIALFSCKNKRPDSTKAYVSAVEFVGGEIKKADSLQLQFTKIEATDGRSDTTAITKDEFKKLAKEFTSLPDISSTSRMEDYKEINDFDESLGNVLLIYTPLKENDEIRNETFMMKPDEQGYTHIRTILITTMKSTKDSTVEKNLTWHVDKRFQVVTKVSKPNGPEKISTVAVQWE